MKSTSLMQNLSGACAFSASRFCILGQVNKKNFFLVEPAILFLLLAMLLAKISVILN